MAMNKFFKSIRHFPIKKQYIYLAHCSVSPMLKGGVTREYAISAAQRDKGFIAALEYDNIINSLRVSASSLLKTSEENVAFVKNTTEGLSLIANGYPFKKGDRIISYIHEYPANHYPWKLQTQKGVFFDLLPNRGRKDFDAQGDPCCWRMSDLRKMVTNKTRVISISHVQFSSGYAANLQELGEFCKDRNIDLVVDAAQSLGCLPVYPDEWNISAVAASGWKWLLGPLGTGLLYTSQALRDKLGHVMVGAESMQQNTNYLDHSWSPYSSSKRFEYSTMPMSLAGAFDECIRHGILRYGQAEIFSEVLRLQELIIAGLDSTFSPLLFESRNRSGILSVKCPVSPQALTKRLVKAGVVVSPRAGYLRLAPHYYLSDDEVLQAVKQINQCAKSMQKNG